MGFPENGTTWLNGKFVAWRDATVHLTTHALHYGSGVFDGIRCYATSSGPACFRLDDHLRRLQDSARVYRMDYPLDLAGWRRVVTETIRINRFDACYIRPLLYRGCHTLGVNPLANPVAAAVIAWEWNGYLGEDVRERGVDTGISSWARIAPNTLPALAKSTANYANAALIKMEALLAGYAEGIALDVSGHVSEGSGQNIFLVRDGVLQTPPLAASILAGITRDTIITLARDLGLEVLETQIPREALYLADEVFLVGTATEVVPVRSVDRIVVGSGRRGPVTEALQRAFFDVVQGHVADRHRWLTPVADVERSEQIEARATA
jgi:branched-chain amino acid aminotransferase